MFFINTTAWKDNFSVLVSLWQQGKNFLITTGHGTVVISRATDGYSEAVKKLLAERFFGSDQLFVKVQFLERYFTFLRALGRMDPVLKTDYAEIKMLFMRVIQHPTISVITCTSL